MIQMYSTDKPLKVCELFAGIGSQIQALKNLGIPCESVISEIDKFAIKSYEAIHGPTENVGDISKVAELPKSDLWTYSFPCQDLSIAGNMKGMEEGSGTRSSLLWEVGRLLKVAKTNGTLPEILLMENVPAILNKNNMGSFQKWIDELTELGYTSSYTVLNAKDFGIPQNRKRCFMVSTLNGKKFRFPTGVPLDKCLRDMLDKDVAESYYFSDEKIEKYEQHRLRHKAAGHGFGWKPTDGNCVGAAVTAKPERHSSNFIVDQGEYKPAELIVAGDLHHYDYESMNRVHDPEGLCPTIKHFSGGGNIPKIEDRIVVAGEMTDTKVIQARRVYGQEGVAPSITAGGGSGSIPKIEDSIAYPSNTKKGYMEAREGDGVVTMRPTKARGTVQTQSIPTLTTGNGCGSGAVVKSGEKLRIRYITERESWRLMGFSDEAFDKAKAAGISKTQLYKQAGNSIVVNVLEAIFRGIYIEETWE